MKKFWEKTERRGYIPWTHPSAMPSYPDRWWPASFWCLGNNAPPISCISGYLWHTAVYLMENLFQVYVHSLNNYPWKFEQPQKDTNPQCWIYKCQTQNLDFLWRSPKTSVEDCNDKRQKKNLRLVLQEIDTFLPTSVPYINTKESQAIMKF